MNMINIFARPLQTGRFNVNASQDIDNSYLLICDHFQQKFFLNMAPNLENLSENSLDSCAQIDER